MIANNDQENPEINPAIANHQDVAWRIIHFGNPQWVVFQCATRDLTPLQNDPDISILPDVPMDMLLSAIPKATRDDAVARLQAAGFETSAIKLSWDWRQLLRYIGKQIDGLFEPESGDVRDSQ
jgi:hypothetical protein